MTLNVDSEVCCCRAVYFFCKLMLHSFCIIFRNSLLPGKNLNLIMMFWKEAKYKQVVLWHWHVYYWWNFVLLEHVTQLCNESPIHHLNSTQLDYLPCYINTALSLYNYHVLQLPYIVVIWSLYNRTLLYKHCSDSKSSYGF